MARLATDGAETGRIGAGDLITGEGAPEIITPTSPYGRGTRCFKKNAAAKTTTRWESSTTLGRDYYARVRVRAPEDNTPSVNADIVDFWANNARLVFWTWNTSGKASIWNNLKAVAIGSTSTGTFEAGKWYTFILHVRVEAAGNGTVGGVIYNEAGEVFHEVADTSVEIGNSAIQRCDQGDGEAGSWTGGLEWDDVAINDSNGTKETGAPNKKGSVLQLLPISDKGRAGFVRHGVVESANEEKSKTFDFHLGTESWTANAGGATSLTQARVEAADSTNDTSTPAAYLQTKREGKGVTNGGPYWEWEGTLESLGVTAGKTVSAMDLDFDWSCVTYTEGASSPIGPAELRDEAGTLLGTFSTSQNWSSTTAWATKNGTELTGLSLAANTKVKLRINANPKTANKTGAINTVGIDFVKVTLKAATLTTEESTEKLWEAVDNVPPEGRFNATSTMTSQIGSANNNNTDYYEANLQTYTSAGVTTGDKVLLTAASGRVGNSSTTSRTIGIKGVSNPEASGSASVVTGTTAAGTDPTGWSTADTAYTYEPTVTKGNSPVVKVMKETASTDRAMADQMGLVVEVETAAGGGGETVKKEFADSLGVADALSKKAAIKRADSISVTAAYHFAMKLSKADSVGVSDKATRKASIKRADSIGVSDSLVSKTLKRVLQFADSIGVADAAKRLAAIRRADSVGVSDKATRKVTIKRADNVSVQDLAKRAVKLTKANSIAVSDALVAARRGLGMKFADSIGVADSLRRSVRLSKADSVAVSDASKRNSSLHKSDTIGVSDTLVSRTLKKVLQFADSLGVADSARRAIGLRKADSVLVGDSARRSVRLTRADSLSVADSASEFIKHILRLEFNDALAVADALWRSVRLSRADSVPVADSVSKSVVLHRGDAIALSDSVAKKLARTMHDALGVSDEVRRSVVLTHHDAIAVTSAFKKTLSGEEVYLELGQHLSDAREVVIEAVPDRDLLIATTDTDVVFMVTDTDVTVDPDGEPDVSVTEPESDVLVDSTHDEDFNG